MWSHKTAHGFPRKGTGAWTPGGRGGKRGPAAPPRRCSLRDDAGPAPRRALPGHQDAGLCRPEPSGVQGPRTSLKQGLGVLRLYSSAWSKLTKEIWEEGKRFSTILPLDMTRKPWRRPLVTTRRQHVKTSPDARCGSGQPILSPVFQQWSGSLRIASHSAAAGAAEVEGEGRGWGGGGAGRGGPGAGPGAGRGAGLGPLLGPGCQLHRPGPWTRAQALGPALRVTWQLLQPWPK